MPLGFDRPQRPRPRKPNEKGMPYRFLRRALIANHPNEARRRVRMVGSRYREVNGKAWRFSLKFVEN